VTLGQTAVAEFCDDRDEFSEYVTENLTKEQGRQVHEHGAYPCIAA